MLNIKGKKGGGFLKYLLMCSMFFVVLTSTNLSIASTVWSDDFSEGNFDGWTVIDGTFSASEHMLLASGEKETSHRIKHSSTTAYGTWSFDVQLNTTYYIENEHLYVYFLTTTFGALGEERGYFLVLWLDPSGGVILGKRPAIGTVLLGTYSYSERFTKYQHIDITRDTNGHFNIFVNGTLRIEGFDDEFTTGNFFGFDSPGGHALDNISVDNEIKILPVVAERSNLEFVEDSIAVTCEQDNSISKELNVRNIGKATGYGIVDIGTTPSGITVYVLGSNVIKVIGSSSLNYDIQNITLKVTVAGSAKAGKHEVPISIKNVTSVFDTILLEVTVPSSGISIIGFEFITTSLLLGILVRIQHKIKIRRD